MAHSMIRAIGIIYMLALMILSIAWFPLGLITTVVMMKSLWIACVVALGLLVLSVAVDL
jgi:hypothetical protein